VRIELARSTSVESLTIARRPFIGLRHRSEGSWGPAQGMLRLPHPASSVPLAPLASWQ
jgi:hypothetical protein